MGEQTAKPGPPGSGALGPRIDALEKALRGLAALVGERFDQLETNLGNQTQELRGIKATVDRILGLLVLVEAPPLDDELSREDRLRVEALRIAISLEKPSQAAILIKLLSSEQNYSPEETQQAVEAAYPVSLTGHFDLPAVRRNVQLLTLVLLRERTQDPVSMVEQVKRVPGSQLIDDELEGLISEVADRMEGV